MGFTASAGAKALSHSLSFGVTLAALTNLAQYATWKAHGRRGSHWQRYGPAYLIAASVPLVLADNVRHLLQDADIWPAPGSSMYREDCPHAVHGFQGITCLTLVGWLFTIVFTYSGFACMMAGVVWGADLHKKLPKAYRDIRRSRSRHSVASSRP